MRKNLILAAILTLVAAAPAAAGGKEGTIGVGAEYGLNGETGGASISYDAGKFHFGGFLGFASGNDDDDTDYTFGARFYYHVHATSMTDFGVGGSIGFFSQDDRNGAVDNRASRIYFEPGIQFRAFIATNVALSFTTGFSFGVSDAEDISTIDGQFNALGGIHYYFFE